MTRHDLITDRTQADIEMVMALIRQNQPLPINNLRFAWDWRAMNRVEQFSKELAELLTSHSYPISIVTKTDWNTESIVDFASEGLRILSNINKLREAFYVLSITPDTPLTIIAMSITEANAIEKILYDLDMVISGMVAALQYGNTFYGGDHLTLLRGNNLL